MPTNSGVSVTLSASKSKSQYAATDVTNIESMVAAAGIGLRSDAIDALSNVV